MFGKNRHAYDKLLLSAQNVINLQIVIKNCNKKNVIKKNVKSELIKIFLIINDTFYASLERIFTKHRFFNLIDYNALNLQLKIF